MLPSHTTPFGAQHHSLNAVASTDSRHATAFQAVVLPYHKLLSVAVYPRARRYAAAVAARNSRGAGTTGSA